MKNGYAFVHFYNRQKEDNEKLSKRTIAEHHNQEHVYEELQSLKDH